MNKKGLSQIVTMVLIILIVLGAIALIWSFFRPTVQDAASRITAECYKINVNLEGCTYIAYGNDPLTYDITVFVDRNAGNGAWTAVKLVFNDGANVVDGSGAVPSELESGNFTVTGANFLPTNVDIAPQVGAEEQICSELGSPIPCNQL